MNIHITKKDLDGIKLKAIERGVPCQIGKIKERQH